MSKVILLGIGRASFRYGIENYNKEKLQCIRDEYLFGIFGDKVVVWYSPAGGVIFQSLLRSI